MTIQRLGMHPLVSLLGKQFFSPFFNNCGFLFFLRAVTTNSVYMKLTLNNCNIGESSLMQINKYMNFPTVEKIGQFIDKAREEEGII